MKCRLLFDQIVIIRKLLSKKMTVTGINVSSFRTVLLWILILTPSTGFVQITITRKADSGYNLMVNGKEFFVKGAVAYEYFSKIKSYGGNAIRIPCDANKLAEAEKSGLWAMVGLPFKSERNGFDYDNAEAVRKQQEEILDLIKKFRHHKSILFWAIGNELDFIPPNKPFNPKIWDAVNSMALAIKSIDSTRPVLTVIGTSRMYKIADIAQRCPALDLLGINTYRDIYSLHDTLTSWGWQKPYIIAEWGPSGYWEVRKTPWKAPFEQTAAEKVFEYQNKYQKVIQGKSGMCIGSFVFYWSGHKQETTHTWFNMFDADGRETPVVDVMRFVWTGSWPTNRAPITDSLHIDGKHRFAVHRFAPSSTHDARVFVTDREQDQLQITWEIRAEAKYAAYAGQGEKEPPPLWNRATGNEQILQFMVPADPGAYRLFVYVVDSKNGTSSANLPFYVE